MHDTFLNLRWNAGTGRENIQSILVININMIEEAFYIIYGLFFLIHIPHFSSSGLVVDLCVYFHGEHQTSYLHIFEPTSDIHCSSQLCQRDRHHYHPHREICHASRLSPKLSCRQDIGSLERGTWQHLFHLFLAMSWHQDVNLQCLPRIHQGRSDIGSNCDQVRHKELAVQVQ